MPECPNRSAESAECLVRNALQNLGQPVDDGVRSNTESVTSKIYLAGNSCHGPDGPGLASGSQKVQLMSSVGAASALPAKKVVALERYI